MEKSKKKKKEFAVYVSGRSHTLGIRQTCLHIFSSVSRAKKGTRKARNNTMTTFSYSVFLIPVFAQYIDILQYISTNISIL